MAWKLQPDGGHGARRRRWRRACAAGVLALVCGWGAPGQSGAPKFHEYEVKAAFLLNFMQFVEWPAAAVTNQTVPLFIGVLGEDPFGAALEATTRGETVQGRPLMIKRERRAADLRGCHLVFIARSEKAHLKDILATLEGCCVLTVSDLEQFCRQGGMIGLVNEGGRIRFEINQAAAEHNNVKISSKLLRLGRLTAK